MYDDGSTIFFKILIFGNDGQEIMEMSQMKPSLDQSWELIDFKVFTKDGNSLKSQTHLIYNHNLDLYWILCYIDLVDLSRV